MRTNEIEYWYTFEHGEDEIEVLLTIEFDYQPYEPEVRYYPDGSGYPGCGEDASIYKITCDNPLFNEDDIPADIIADMIEKCCESMHIDDRDY